MNTTQTLLAALAVAVAFASAALAEPLLPVNPGLTDAMTPALPAHQELTLGTLEDQLRDTRAINPFMKLELKSEVDDLLAEFRLAHASGQAEVDALRQPYDELIDRIQAMLKQDRKLARDIAASKQGIWEMLADRTRFASLQ